MINLLSFTHSVSSHVILSVFSFSSIISNTFLCTDSLFLSIKELEHCIWNCLEHVVDDRQKIGTYFTETHWNTCLHLAALELYIEVKLGESWKEKQHLPHFPVAACFTTHDYPTLVGAVTRTHGNHCWQCICTQILHYNQKSCIQNSTKGRRLDGSNTGQEDLYSFLIWNQYLSYITRLI